MFVPGDKEVKRCSELFNEKLFKRLSRKLRKESEELQIRKGRLYHGNTLYRYAGHHGIDCEVRDLKTHRVGFIYYQYIKIGDFVFEVAKIKGYEQKIQYRLTEAVQLELI